MSLPSDADVDAVHLPFMDLALAEAVRGVGRTHPNPPVGAVLVRNGVVVGRGHHRRAGQPHAEVEAIRSAGEAARGADMYVTLEPHDHQGRTPPCTLAIINAGVQRVFCGVEDPNPLVAGRGFQRLRHHGIPVTVGLRAQACAALIRPFATLMSLGRPHVVLKAAVTLDGKLATATGDSRWVSGPAARQQVHRWRDELDAVLVGAGTVRADAPRLTTRLEGPAVSGRPPRNPVRVVLSGRLDLPMGSPLWDISEAPTRVYTACEESHPLAQRLLNRGVDVVSLPKGNRDAGALAGALDLPAVLAHLGGLGLTSLLVEGGAAVHAAFWRAQLVDELRLFVAPRIVGGDGRSWVGPLGIGSMADALALEITETTAVGDDWLVRAVPRPVQPAGAV